MHKWNKLIGNELYVINRIQVSKCLVVLTRDSKRQSALSDGEREPDEILQNSQAHEAVIGRRSFVAELFWLVPTDIPLLLTYIRKELWLVPHTLLGHFIVTNLHSENLHDSNSVYLRKRSRHKNGTSRVRYPLTCACNQALWPLLEAQTHGQDGGFYKNIHIVVFSWSSFAYITTRNHSAEKVIYIACISISFWCQKWRRTSAICCSKRSNWQPTWTVAGNCRG